MLLFHQAVTLTITRNTGQPTRSGVPKTGSHPQAARHLFMKQDCFCFFDTSIITAHKLHCCVWQAKIYPGKCVGALQHMGACAEMTNVTQVEHQDKCLKF